MSSTRDLSLTSFIRISLHLYIVFYRLFFFLRFWGEIQRRCRFRYCHHLFWANLYEKKRRIPNILILFLYIFLLLLYWCLYWIDVWFFSQKKKNSFSIVQAFVKSTLEFYKNIWLRWLYKCHWYLDKKKIKILMVCLSVHWF